MIVGVSAPGLDVMHALTQQVMDRGAAGVMVAPGAGLKTDEAIEGYCAAVVRRLGDDVPLVQQDSFPLMGPRSRACTCPRAA